MKISTFTLLLTIASVTYAKVLESDNDSAKRDAAGIRGRDQMDDIMNATDDVDKVLDEAEDAGIISSEEADELNDAADVIDDLADEANSPDYSQEDAEELADDLGDIIDALSKAGATVTTLGYLPTSPTSTSVGQNSIEASHTAQTTSASESASGPETSAESSTQSTTQSTESSSTSSTISSLSSTEDSGAGLHFVGFGSAAAALVGHILI